MSSTKISAPRTFWTLPSAWIADMSPPRSQLPADDREALVVDGDGEADRLPEPGERCARRVFTGSPLGVRLDRREAATGEVVADRFDETTSVALPSPLRGRRDARDDG